MGLALIRKKKKEKQAYYACWVFAVRVPLPPPLLIRLWVKLVSLMTEKNSYILLKDFFPCRNGYKQSNCVDAMEGKCQKQSVNLSLSNLLKMAVPVQIVVQEGKKWQKPAYHSSLKKSFTL